MSPLIAFVAFTLFLQSAYVDWYNRRPEASVRLTAVGPDGFNLGLMLKMFRQTVQPDMSRFLRVGLRVHKGLCVLIVLCLATAVIVGLVHPIGR